MFEEYLCSINEFVCAKDYGMRESASASFSIIKDAFYCAMNSISENEILVDSMKVAALIKLLQPFYDGNHRTALITFGDLLVEKGFDFDYYGALEDMKSKKLNIPTIYDVDDKLSSFHEWDKYIYISKKDVELKKK